MKKLIVFFVLLYTLPVCAQLRKHPGKILGADISFLPELEAKGMHFYDQGKEKDAIAILKDHGFNYIRLRIFNNPAADSGYSPGKGFCDLAHTLQMARRVKQADLKLLLDFHYSDFWADPGKQYKPAGWKQLDADQLNTALGDFTRQVLLALKQQGTLPDIVQIGNEINHGMLWPDANTRHPDTLARLLKTGTAAVRAVDSSIIIMMHLALGGQNEESRWWLDNMLARGLSFDMIGLSYYPQWHGSVDDLKNNMTDLATRYPQELCLVEYSECKREVNEVVFNLPDHKGIGTCIWEPLNTWEAIFDKQGRSNAWLDIYDELAK
jgi:arabinogalactan endo-1,4-beta-galactosidase